MPTKRKARKRVAKALKTYVRREIARVKNPRVSLPKQWTKVEMRQDAHGNVQVRGNAPLRNSGKPAKNVKELVVYGKPTGNARRPRGSRKLTKLTEAKLYLAELERQRKWKALQKNKHASRGRRAR